MKSHPTGSRTKERTPRAWVGLCVLTFLLMTLPAGARQGADDAPTTPPAQPTLKLKPILKPEPRRVKLQPIEKNLAPQEDPHRPTVHLEPLIHTRPSESRPEPEPTPPATDKPTTPSEPTRAEASVPNEIGSELPDPVLEALQAPPSVERRARMRRFVLGHLNHPRVPELLIRIGQMSLDLDDPQEALKAFRAVTHKRFQLTGQQRRYACIGLARAAYRTGDFDLALKQFDWLDNMDEATASLSPDLLAARAWCYMTAGAFDQADQAWQAVPIDRAEPRLAASASLAQGLLAELRGRPDQARRMYLDLLERFGEQPAADQAKRRLQDLDRRLLP